MKKYLRLTCDVCQRSVDRTVDNSRFTPDLCTITYKCQGRLFPVEYRSDGQITSAPKVGITDWQPRETKANRSVTAATAVATQTLIDTSCGSKHQLVLAVALAAAPANTVSVSLTLRARSDTPKNFQQYIFRRDTSFINISGVESGLEQKTLKYSVTGLDPDIVEVYLNGAKLEQGLGTDQFQIYDPSLSPNIAPNTIQFGSTITPNGIGQVDVIISKAQTLDERVLTFKRNKDDDARLKTGAWENVSYIDRFNGTSWDRFYLFYYDVIGTLPTELQLNTIVYPVGSVVVSSVGAVALSSAYFLLARDPYTQLDRYPDISVRLDTLSADRDYLKYHTVNGTNRLEVTDTSLSTFFPPTRIARFNVEVPLTSQVGGQSEQVIVDGLVVVGPDT